MKKIKIKINYWASQRKYRIIFLGLFFIGGLLIVKSLSGKYIQRRIQVPRDGLVVVDKKTKDEECQNGSLEHPFSKLTDAIDLVTEQPKFTTILLRSGSYQGPIILPAGTKLIGSGDTTSVEVTSSKNENASVVTAEKDNLIANLKIQGGKYGLLIQKDAHQVNIVNITISKANKWGLLNQSDSQKKPRILVIESHIVENKDQGAYLLEGIFHFIQTEISRNGEEGLDFHRNIEAKVKDCDVIGNGEGGIEIDLKENSLLIENSIIEGNRASGVNLQSNGKGASVVLKNNLIKGNKKFGVRCAIHSGFNRGYFAKAVTVEKNNIVVANPSGGVSPICYR